MKLVPFPPSLASIEFETQLKANAAGFVLSFEIQGAGADQILTEPRSSHPARRNELWKETCIECFFGVAGSTRYFEFNGASTGDWALYSFDDYRKGMKEVTLRNPPLLIKFERLVGKISGEWIIPFFTDALLREAAVTAVLKMSKAASSEGVSYWALKHAADKPDFHLRGSFVHRLI